MKIRLGQDDWLTLDRPKLERRFRECARYSALVTEVRCGLDRAADALSDPAGARRPAALKGLAQASAAAVQIKKEFGIAEDRTAYALEKGTRDLSRRLGKGKEIDPVVAKRALAGLRTVESKIKAMDEVRKNSVCGIRRYEGVRVEREI